MLEKHFGEEHQPSKEKYTEIADEMGCKISHIRNWFSNKRKKIKNNQHDINDKTKKVTTSPSNTKISDSLQSQQIPPQQPLIVAQPPTNNIYLPPSSAAPLNHEGNPFRIERFSIINIHLV